MQNLRCLYRTFPFFRTSAYQESPGEPVPSAPTFDFKEDLAEAKKYTGDERTEYEWQLRAEKLSTLSEEERTERQRSFEEGIVQPLRQIETEHSFIDHELTLDEYPEQYHSTMRKSLHIYLEIQKKHVEANGLTHFPDYAEAITKNNFSIPPLKTISAETLKTAYHELVPKKQEEIENLWGDFHTIARRSIRDFHANPYLKVLNLEEKNPIYRIESRNAPSHSAYSHVDRKIHGGDNKNQELFQREIREILKSVTGKEIDFNVLDQQTSDRYFDMVLSRIQDPSRPDVYLAVLSMFPKTGPERFAYCFAKILEKQKNNPDEVHVLLELFRFPLSQEQQEQAGDMLLTHGTDLDIHYFQKKYPDIYKKITDAKKYPEREGYLSAFGNTILLDRGQETPGETHIIVHPFYSLFFEGTENSIRSPNDLEQYMVRTARDGKYLVALEIAQEYEKIKETIARGETIIFVLGRYSHSSKERSDHYTQFLKNLLGDYKNFRIVESVSFGTGDIIDSYHEDLKSRLAGRQLVFSGGYVGACLAEAKGEMRSLGLEGVYDIPASSMGTYEAIEHTTKTIPESTKVESYEDLKKVFAKNKDVNEAFDNIVTGRFLEEPDVPEQNVYEAVGRMQYQKLETEMAGEKILAAASKNPAHIQRWRLLELRLKEMDLEKKILGHYAARDDRFGTLYRIDREALEKSGRYREDISKIREEERKIRTTAPGQ